MKKLGLALVWLLVVVGMFSAHTNRVDAQRGDLYGARAIQSLEQLLNADGVIGEFEIAGDLTIADGFQLLLPDGVLAAPALAATANPGTGLYFAGGEVFVADNGAFAARFRSLGFQAPAGNVTNAGLTFGNDPGDGLYYIGVGNLGMTMGDALVMDWEDTNAAGAGADLVTISSTLGIMDGAGDVVRYVYADVTNANHTGGNVLGFEANMDAADADAVETAYRAVGAWDYTLRQAGVAFAAIPAAEVGAMVYCVDCDLGSVPCASTPGPGAWAFGTSTGPRWECPW